MSHSPSGTLDGGRLFFAFVVSRALPDDPYVWRTHLERLAGGGTGVSDSDECLGYRG
jgi:hypothetical protein